MEIIVEDTLNETNNEKSVFPDINLYSFSSLPPIIKDKKEEIGKNLFTLYNDKNLSFKRHRKNKSMINKSCLKNHKIKSNLMERRNSTYMGESDNIVLPRKSQIDKIIFQEQKKKENELVFSDDEIYNNKNKNKSSFFFLSALNNNSRNKESNLKYSLSSRNNYTNETNKFSIFKDKIKLRKRVNKSINYFKTIQKDIKYLDYENTINLKHIKRQKKYFETIDENMENILRIYNWKYLMTDSDKDLRPDTFYGKAGEEVYGKQSFNRRLDSIITNIKDNGFTFSNIKDVLGYKSKNNMTNHINKRIQDEKEKRKFINNLLEKNTIIYNSIMN